LAGLIVLLLDLTFPTVFFSPLMFVWILQCIIPLAGFLGLIPFSIIFYYLDGYYFSIGYAILIPTILGQRKVVDRLRAAITENKKEDVVFKIAISHHLWTCGFLLFDLQGYTKGFFPYIYTEGFGILLNILIAFFIWRWIKSG